jgi:spermidine/putrescine transport system substrate-binding protein
LYFGANAKKIERNYAMAIRNLKRGASRRSILQQTGAAAIGITFAGAGASCSPGGGGRVVQFYNWDTYIGETTLADFQESTGVTAEMSLFATNDELFAKLRAGNPGYDVIVPSNEFVTRMSEAQMILPLDRSLIPNFSNLSPQFQDAAFDPGRQYSMPYTWLTLGLGYRKSAMDGIPDSWKWVFDSDRYTGKIALLSESADLIRLCAKYKGHSVNGIPDAMLSEIEQMLIRQKPHVKAFHEDNGQDLLVSGEVDIVIEYSGDLAQVVSEEGGDEFGYVIPREGTLINQDCLCIPTGAPNVEDAHAFINYLLDAEAGAKIADYIQYGTPNAAARELLDDSYKNNPITFPPAETMMTCEYGAFEGAERAQLYEEIITRVRAA